MDSVEKPEWLPQVEAVLETLNEGVLISDDCHHIIFVNERFAEMTGFSPSEVLGRLPGHFYEGEDQGFLNQQIAHGEAMGSNRFEFYLPRKGGGRLPVMMSARSLEDPDGRQFAVVTFTDISDQKAAETRLREVNAQLEERAREIELELTLAARVQQSLAPKGIRWGRVAVETFYLPVRTIGGDFGLVSATDDRKLNLLVCDVSGHGISSALMANRIYSETMSHLERGTELGEMLRQLNRFVLHYLGTSGFFFSMAVARVDSDGRELTFAGGGHPPAMVVSADGRSRLLKSQALILGTLEEAVGDGIAERVELQTGDRVVLYSDGFTDVFDAHDEILGVEGLEDIVRKAARHPLPEMKQAILQGIENWRYGPPADDTSLILAEIL